MRITLATEQTPLQTMALSPVTPLREGALLADRFTIRRLLGRGGMGEVYHASDRELGADVALKVIRPDAIDEGRLLRFRREVQMARQVTHPNICRVFDLGFHQTSAGMLTFLTMEYIEGVTLSRYLRERGRLNAEEFLPLARHIANGLDALHAKGIVHRDFKPDNVMIAGGEEPRAVITDFGLARPFQTDTGGEPGESALTRPGHVVGTPLYMSPEQLLGKEVTPASDIYAFGLLLYEAVTGMQPFPGGAGSPFQRALARLQSAPAPTGREVPPSWELTLRRCLETDPAKRPASAGEVVDALSGSPAKEGSRPAMATKWRIVGTVAALCALLLTAALVLYFFPARSTQRPTHHHIAVLGFSASGQAPEMVPFADGLMEGITGRLSQFEGLDASLMVVPAAVVRQQGAKTPNDAKAKFGADQVIQGTLQTQGQRVRLLLTLIDTRQMTQITSVVVEDLRSNALTLEDAAVEKLAGALGLRVRPDQSRDPVARLAPGAYEYYLQARGYLQRPDKLPGIESAVQLFQRVLDIDPKSAVAFTGLAEAYNAKFHLTRDTHWMEEAQKAVTRALEINPNLWQAYVTRGQIYSDTGHYEEARADFEKALEGNNLDSAAYIGLGAAYDGLKQYDKAEATYKKAIALRPEDWTGYRNLGYFYYRRGDLANAIQQYRQVVALTPDNAQGYTNLGAMQILNGDADGARVSLERALQLDPNRVSALSNLAKIHFDKGQYQEAIKLYQRATELNKKDFRMPGGLGIAYKRSGDADHARVPLESAVRLLDQELKLNPSRAELYSYKALYLAALGRAAEVPPLLKRVAELAPDDLDLMVRAAETHATLGANAAAGELIQKLLAKGYSRASLNGSAVLRPLLASPQLR